MAEKLSTEKYVMPGFGSKSPLGKEGFTPPQEKKKDDEKGPGQGTKTGQFTGSGIPDNLFNADGDKVNSNNIDEGNLSKIKVESGTNRKYVSYLEGSKAGGRLYLSNPK